MKKIKIKESKCGETKETPKAGENRRGICKRIDAEKEESKRNE